MPNVFSFKDVYPSYVGNETSTEVIPEENDMEALVENGKDAEEVGRGARTKNILIATGILVALVIFLGGAK